MTSPKHNPGGNASVNIADELQRALAALSGAFPQTVAVAAGEQRLDCALTSLDRLGCEFERLTLATPALAGASLDRLQAISADLAARLTYLLEAIGPIEHDHEQCVVQMRSTPPQQGDDGASYYELLVRRGGELALCRFRKPAGQPRQAIPAVVTREVLLRLAADLSAAVA